MLLIDQIRGIFAQNPEYYGLMIAVGGIFIITGAILIRDKVKIQKSDVFSMFICKPFDWNVFFMLLGIASLAAGIFLLIIL